MESLFETVNNNIDFDLENKFVDKILIDIFYWIQAVGFFAAFGGILLIWIMFYVFVIVPQFHQNFIIIMGNAVISFTIMTIARIVLFVQIWNCPRNEIC